MSDIVSQTKTKLTGAGFQIIGEYQPYDGADVIVVTNDAMKKAATESKRGGYGAVEHVAVTQVGSNVQVSYTDPTYWSNAYRMKTDMPDVRSALVSALGDKQSFGSGDKTLTASDMRDYHYTFMMEYFTDPSKLGTFDSHAKAVAAVDAGLAAHKGGTSQVYKLEVGKDPRGKDMTLYGVALNGTKPDDCSGDKYIMSRIDIGPRRHTAALPYEMMVYGDKAEALYGRFRIAISFPSLPMMAGAKGATFFNIMCAPGAIEKALKEAAGND